MNTTAEAEAILFKFWREAPAWRKLQLMEDLNRMTRLLALGGLRDRHPNASSQELRRRLADLLLGEELAEKAYGPRQDVLDFDLLLGGYKAIE